MFEDCRNYCLLWQRIRESYSGSSLYFQSLWDKGAKCFLWARMNAKESSRTGVVIKGSCPSNYHPGLGTPTERTKTRVSQRVHLLLAGNNAIIQVSKEQKVIPYLPLRRLQSHVATTQRRSFLYFPFPSSLWPPPDLRKYVGQGRKQKTKIDPTPSFPTADFEPESGWELQGEEG